MNRPASPSTGRKLALTSGLIVASIVYAFWQKPVDAQSAIVTTLPAAPVSTPVQPRPMMPAMMPKHMGMYADGSYTGTPADAYYGTVQVKAIVSGGKLTDVQFVQYPQSHSNSIFINSRAMPILKQEAIAAQSAQVNGVSGATFMSSAFTQSLSSALAQAKA